MAKGGHILPTGTVTLLFTDIEGSTPLWEQMPTDMKHAVEQHHAILRKIIEANGGQVFQILGDAFQAAFSLPNEALSAAIQAQKEFLSAEWGATGPLRVRMGLHTGPVELSSIPNQAGVREYAVCHTLNRAARVMSAGYGGQILVSQETMALIERELPEGVSLRDLGEHRLKGMRRLEHLYQVVVSGLPDDFPALVTGIGRPHNLPAEMTSFIGRERELAELKEILNEPNNRLVTVTGPGGMGKTRLALRVAEELLATYVDGVWLVELVALNDPVLLPQAVAHALHVREIPGQQILKLLQEFLYKKRLLLVLDNCEHLTQAVGGLAGHLLRTCRQMQILATSREVLNLQGEIIFQCPSLLTRSQLKIKAKSSTNVLKELAPNQAIRLFTDRASAAFLGFQLTPENISTIDNICFKVDGIPLAIELAAARVRVLSVDQVAKRLDDVMHLLTGGAISATPHHQAIEALIDWSYNLLAPAEKIVFQRLSVFMGGWDLEAAEAITSGDGIDKFQIVDLIAQLLDKSLIRMETLECGENRYQMLEIIRQYANEKLQEVDNHLAIYKRHLDYFSNLVDQAVPYLWEKEQEEWLQRLSKENDNLRAALQWSLKRDSASVDEVEAGTIIATALWYVWYFFGVVKEALGWLELALARSPRPNQIRARLLSAYGTFEWQLGNLKEAANRLRQSLDLFQSLSDTRGLAEATHMYGHIVFDQQNYIEAERVFKESLSIYESLNNLGVKVALIGDLGLVACHQGDLKLARDYYDKCLALSIHNKLKDNEAQSYLRIGDISRLEGEYKKAEEYYQKGLSINREMKFSREIASSLHKLGFIALHGGDLDQAQSLFKESLTMQEQAINQQGMAECLAGLASVKVKRGEDEDAALYYGAARQILVRTGLPLAPADVAEWIRDEKVARRRCNSDSFELSWSKGLEASIDDLVASILT